MRVENSPYKESVLKTYELDSGLYYFFDEYIIAENKEGIIFSWETAKVIIDLKYQFYGDRKITYISNRVNSYSVVPQDWLKFFEQRHEVLGVAIVTYSDLGIMNVTLEKLFFRSKLKRFERLEAAIDWAKSLLTPIEDKE